MKGKTTATRAGGGGGALLVDSRFGTASKQHHKNNLIAIGDGVGNVQLVT